MSKIVEFLSNLKEFGNAKVIIEEGKNKYKAYTILVDENGGIIANIVNYTTDTSYITDGKVNPKAKILFASSEDEPNENYVKYVIAKVIAVNYQEQVYAIKGDNLKFDYRGFDFRYFFEIANEMLKVSNHSLVCSECAENHKYLDRYLISALDETKLATVDLEEVKNRDEYLEERIKTIKELASTLKTSNGQEYLEASTMWTRMYDDHKKQEEYSLKLTSN